jgi:uncharacterized protein (UPF0548 family)
VFRLGKPDAGEVGRAIRAASEDAGAGRRWLSLRDGIAGQKLPFGFAHDCLRTQIGNGADVFAAARRAFAEWAEFDPSWVRVANPEVPIAAGEIVAVEVHALGLWSLHLSRIVETTDTATQFGFLYATTAFHGQEGEERFVIEFDPVEGGVWYQLEAVSRPRHLLARTAFPITRALQHRFARDSHDRMRRAVLGC